MPHYHVRFLKGPNMTLRLYHDSIETAESFEQVLRRHTTWPIQISWDHVLSGNVGSCPPDRGSASASYRRLEAGRSRKGRKRAD